MVSLMVEERTSTCDAAASTEDRGFDIADVERDIDFHVLVRLQQDAGTLVAFERRLFHCEGVGSDRKRREKILPIFIGHNLADLARAVTDQRHRCSPERQLPGYQKFRQKWPRYRVTVRTASLSTRLTNRITKARIVHLAFQFESFSSKAIAPNVCSRKFSVRCSIFETWNLCGFAGDLFGPAIQTGESKCGVGEHHTTIRDGDA